MRTRLLQGSLLVILFTSAVAQAAHKSLVITHQNVVLRSGANKHTHRLALLSKGQHLRLLDLAPKNGFFHVETADTEGWVSSDLSSVISLEEGEGPSDLSPATSDEISTEQSKLEGFHKIASNAKTVTINGQSCPAEGRKPEEPDDLDPATNIQKNRTDTAEDDGADYVAIHLETVRDLPFPDALKGTTLKNRKDWVGPNAGLATDVARFEGVPVRVVGFLVKWKDEGNESCNCEYAHVANHDVHLPFTVNAGEGEENSVVMEITPRIKRNKQHWQHRWLKPSEDDHRPIRVSGWLMLDPKHPEMLGDFRQTLWEVHPITKLEVLVGTDWVDVESLDTPQ